MRMRSTLLSGLNSKANSV